MLAYLQGKVLKQLNTALIVLVNNIGYQVAVTEEVALKSLPDSEIKLYLAHVVREDADDLYGFLTWEELELFHQLVSVSGVGPRTALSALNLVTVSKMQQAIAKGDATILKQISGIGPKTAERIVVELRDKMKQLGVKVDDLFVLDEDNEVVEGLIGLGYSAQQARQSVSDLPSDIRGVGARLKAALQRVGSSRNLSS